MAAYDFPLSLGEAPLDPRPGHGLPITLQVMYAGERVCDAHLAGDCYACDLPHEYQEKLRSGKLQPIFVFEPPLVQTECERIANRELVSILLVAAAPH